MNTTIIIHSKSNYGNVSWYVSDATQAKLIATLTGKKTVSHSDVVALTALGFTVRAWNEGQLIDALDAMTGGVTVLA